MSSRRMADPAPIVAAVLLLAGTTFLTVSFGVVPLLIVGVPGVTAYVLWYVAYRPESTSPHLVSLFLASVGGFALHAVEEYLGHYGPAVGRLFGFAWTDDAFVVTVFALLFGLCLVAVGLQRHVRLAGFVAALFLTTRLAELALFIFPLIRPAIEPDVATPVSRVVGGTLVRDMPSYCFGIVRSYYFPGMLTVALPVVPAALALRAMWRGRPRGHSG
jgi:hypothetical protein